MRIACVLHLFERTLDSVSTNEQMAQIMTSLFTVVRTVNTGAQTMGLDKSAIIALYAVRQHEGIRPSAVAGACALDQSTISRQLKSLEEKGLITRSPDPADRRAQLLALTPDGEGLLSDMDDLRRARLEEALAEWSDDDRAQLHAVIGRLADALVVADARRIAGLGH